MKDLHLELVWHKERALIRENLLIRIISKNSEPAIVCAELTRSKNRK
jgi:hypothetical protein